METTKKLNETWASLLEIDGKETPGKMKCMLIDIMLEVAQTPEHHWIFDEHAFFLKELYRAFDSADKILNEA